jgi:SAM-dependent methyltransferase
MTSTPDTFDRSMAHWSEAGRAEMDAFYRVATQDYRELAESRDWPAWLEDADPILDVACGSGKFPAALARYAGLGEAPRTLDLLDPSRFSIDETKRNLELPFVAGDEYACRIQDLPAGAGPWRRVWATHALYAVPPAELDAAAARFVKAIASGGRGFIAHARADSFYLAFHRAYLEGWCGGVGTPFTTAEDWLAAFERQGVRVEVRDIAYVGELPADARDAAQGFLQRCLFDETVSLDAMEADPGLGAMLRAHRGADGRFRFPQRVALIDLAA